MAYTIYSTSEKQAWVAELTEQIPLTPLDYTSPQNYIMRCLGFPFPDWNDQAHRDLTVEYCKTRLSSVFKLFPFLAGQGVRPKGGELPKLVYERTKPNLERFPEEVFDSRVFDRLEFP
ncbi:hypothetical protein N656DRAFT_719989, partial [Canariomyces notabilis]